MPPRRRDRWPTPARPDLDRNLAVNASVALTYSVTAHQPATGDKAMVTIVTSTAVGNSCPPPERPPCRTTVLVLTPGLTITSAANVATSVPGATISYTITATNTGQIPLVDAGFTIALAGVLDDATYNNNATATVGAVAVVSSVLSWEGTLALGQATTIRYTVTVGSPVAGRSAAMPPPDSSSLKPRCTSQKRNKPAQASAQRRPDSDYPRR